MNDQELKELLDKYLSGDLSVGEEARLDAWFEKRQTTGKDLFDERSGGFRDAAYEKQQFLRIARELGLRTKVRKRKWWVAAAAVLLITGLGMGYIVYQSNNNLDPMDIAQQVNLPALDSASWKLITNTGAATKKLVMADGSKISLYPGSEIKYDSALYNVQNRRLYLSGKGFFDVAHEATKPFVVYSRGISTMALGTAFTVNAYGSMKKIQIDLIRGKVRIRKEPRKESRDSSIHTDHTGFKDIILEAGEYFSYDVTMGKITRGRLSGTLLSDKKAPKMENSDVVKPSATKSLTYDRAALSKVIEDIQSAYQIHIDYDKKDMNAIQFSGSIAPGDSIRHILKKIGLLNDLQITEVGKSGFRIDKLKN